MMGKTTQESRMEARERQYHISKITSHDAILDILAEDAEGKLYNIEIQRASDIDHARRTRFYGAMIDSEYLEKGTEYYEMPDVHIIYISETDLWKAGKTTYPVEKYFKGTGILYDDGMHVLYVNAEVNDGTDTAKMMKYFMTADPGDMSQGDLSKRIHFLKCEEGGNDIMCEITEKWLKEGRLEGRLEGEEKKLINLVCRKIIKGKDVNVIADELEEEPATIEPIYHAALQCAPEYDCNTIYNLLAEH